jgi:hypothetical protein
MQNQKPLQLDTTVATNSSNMQDTSRSGNKYAKFDMVAHEESLYQRKQKTNDFDF